MFGLVFGCMFEGESQTGYTLSVEPVITHTTPYLNPFTGDTVNLNGMTTYRMYVNTVNQSDLVSALAAFDSIPLILSSTSVPAWYNDTLYGTNFGSEMNTFYFSFLPHLQYDSWLTIGAAESTPGYTLSETAPAPHWAAFNAGQNININSALGWSLFGLNPCPTGVGCNYTHPAYGGPDYKVLLGQITTAGVLSGVLNIQLFVGGLGANDQLLSFAFEGPGTYGLVVPGCTDETACNYDVDATSDDGSCTFPDVGYTCAGTCISDVDSDGVCDALDVPGCTDGDACNFDAAATDEDGSCTYAQAGYTCAGACLSDGDGDGTCDANEVDGCTNEDACNFNPNATDDDGTCLVASGCDSCMNGAVMDGDSDDDGVCDTDEIEGCTDAAACNFDDEATDDDGTCQLIGVCDDCIEGVFVDGDVDDDGLCDAAEVEGCTNPLACNYNDLASNDDGSCLVAGPCDVCLDGDFTDGDADDDSVCDGDEVAGCTVEEACNYDVAATDDDGTCVFAIAGYDCDGVCLSDIDGDEVCDEFEIAGCTDLQACNYNPAATDDNGSCLTNDACGVCGGNGIPAGACDCAGNTVDAVGVCGGSCAADVDNDDVCDTVDPCVGSFDSCGVCNGPGAVYTCGCTGIPAGDCDCFGNQTDAIGVCGGDCAADVDMDGVCDIDEIPGCTDMEACNYDADATDDDGSCLQLDACGICGGPGIPAGDCDCDGNQLDAVGVCGGDCIADTDGDGVCDTDEILGCTDENAPNYNPEATEDDGSCIVCTLVAGTVESTDVSCFGGSDGGASWTVSGGESITYFLLPGDNTNTTGGFEGLVAGTYTILAFDANDCVLEQVITVGEPDVLEVTIDEITDAVDNDGAIDISIDGGVEPYVISWTGTAGAATGYTSADEDIEGLATGTYAVVVTDANGCTAEGEAVIDVNGLDEALGFGFVVFPNPSTDAATLVWGGSQAVEWMTVTDGLGRVVESVRIAGTEGRMELNAGNFSSGVYTISVGASTGVSTQRWVIAN